MTDTAWKPTPGRDAMTRDGRRVFDLEHATDASGRGIWFGTLSGYRGTWRETGQHVISHSIDLVADWPDADPLPDADGVRPAPSGPVVEETVKRIVPGVYGRVKVSLSDSERDIGVTLVNRKGEAGSYLDGAQYLTRSELLAAAETLRQIGEAMEGK